MNRTARPLIRVTKVGGRNDKRSMLHDATDPVMWPALTSTLTNESFCYVSLSSIVLVFSVAIFLGPRSANSPLKITSPSHDKSTSLLIGRHARSAPSHQLISSLAERRWLLGEGGNIRRVDGGS